MITWRLLRYAESQARVRARLGHMPNTQQWQNIACAGDLNHMIERMRANGLGFWLDGLPQNPCTLTIEQHLHHRSIRFIDDLLRLLPTTNWQPFRACLRLLPDLLPLELLLTHEKPELPDAVAATLQDIARLPLAQRRAALAATPYASLVTMDSPPGIIWLDQMTARLPKMTGTEAAVLHRMLNILHEHSDAIRQLRTHYRERLEKRNDADQDQGNRHSTAAAVPALSQWSLRDQLYQRLRMLLVGDPFHAGLILLYGLLGSLQFERLRALLIAQSRHWPNDTSHPADA